MPLWILVLIVIQQHEILSRERYHVTCQLRRPGLRLHFTAKLVAAVHRPKSDSRNFLKAASIWPNHLPHRSRAFNTEHNCAAVAAQERRGRQVIEDHWWGNHRGPSENMIRSMSIYPILTLTQKHMCTTGARPGKQNACWSESVADRECLAEVIWRSKHVGVVQTYSSCSRTYFADLWCCGQGNREWVKEGMKRRAGVGKQKA